MTEISALANVRIGSVEVSKDFNENLTKDGKYVDGVLEKLKELAKQRTEVTDSIGEYERALNQVQHLKGLDADFEKLFSCEHIKVRFGRLPVDSYNKLPYYDDKTFYFEYFTEETEYYWGLYITPVSCAEEVDGIFKSLYLDRKSVV